MDQVVDKEKFKSGSIFLLKILRKRIIIYCKSIKIPLNLC